MARQRLPNRPLSSTPTERQRRCRQRRREGVRLVRIEVGVESLGALLDRGWLSKPEARDDAALEAAVFDLIDCWAR